MTVYDGLNYEIADSYISVDELTQIIDNEIPLSQIDESVDKEKLIVTASRLIDNMFKFKGEKLNDLQKLEFPRNFEEYVINENIKIFTAYVCTQLIEDANVFFEGSTIQTKSEKVDELEISYYESTEEGFEKRLNLYYFSLIKKFLVITNSASASRMLNVVRG